MLMVIPDTVPLSQDHPFPWVIVGCQTPREREVLLIHDAKGQLVAEVEGFHAAHSIVTFMNANSSAAGQ